MKIIENNLNEDEKKKIEIEKKLKDNIIFLYNQITKGCFRNHCYNNLCITNKIAQQINNNIYIF